MRDDDDIARLLPEPPPPRAARRGAAIEAAMRRFDGAETGPAPASAGVAWRRPAWTKLSGPQIGAFASIALVALVGVPLALRSLEERLPPSAPPAPVSVAAKGAAPGPAAPAERRPTAAAVPSAAAEAKPREAEPAAETLPPPVLADNARDVAARAPAAPPPAEEVPQFVAPSPEPPPIAVTGSRAAAPSMAVSKRVASTDTDSADIIITASRSTRPAAAYRRGDWNACTVNDPAESLAGCKSLLDPGAGGARGQAAARVAEGLSLAWGGDLDGAIAAFDAAIALQPRLAIAWLNRGLAYQRQGDTAHALADLNRAVRYAPNAARGYYNRSVLLEQTGDARRARADADRAVTIDPRYRAALE